MTEDETYKFGDFRLEVSRRRLLRGAERVPLTPKALDTLVMLVRHAGHTVEKDELLNAVWAGTFVEESTVAQNIATLRRVFGEGPDDPKYIATVPRRGYTFIAPVRRTGQDETVSGHPALPPESTANRAVRRLIALAVVMMALVATAAIVWFRKRPDTHQPTPVARFLISPPANAVFSSRGGFMAMSPDGRFITYVATGPNGVDSVWLRALDAVDARPLPSTDHASQLFWSADGERIAFFADGSLKSVAIAGGAETIICPVPGNVEPYSGTWSADNQILFSVGQPQLYRVPAAGGVATPMKVPGIHDGEIAAWPQFLADGRHFLYVVQSFESGRAGLYLGLIDGGSERISDVASYAVPVPGYILYVDQGTLRAQPVADGTLRPTGSPIALAYRVQFNANTLRGVFAASRNGVVAFRTADQTQLTWVTRDGRSVGTIGDPATYLEFAIAPDGLHVAASVLDPVAGTSDIEVHDSDGSGMHRLTNDGTLNVAPSWSRDGSHIEFMTNHGGTWVQKAKSWQVAAAAQTIPTEGALESSADVQLSPDGRWSAYEDKSRGGTSVAIRSTASPDRTWQLSTGEASAPRWRADSREIYYLASDLFVMAVTVGPGPDLGPGTPVRLFRAALNPSGVVGDLYEPAPDGKRFLLKEAISRSDIVVVTNWLDR